MAPHRAAVYVKDFCWDGRKIVTVPLGEGNRKFFSLVKKRGLSGPVSLHEEYIDPRDAALVPRHWEAVRRDLATRRTWLSEA